MDQRVPGHGVELAVRDHGGTGTPVLLLPGGGGTLADLGPLARHLLPRHRVMAMELRNHGMSGDGPWTWDAVLRDVRAVVEHFGLTRPVIAGHSLGGMVAALYLERYGDLTAAVNLDGHGSGKPEQYDMDSVDVIRLLDELKATSGQQLDALLGPHSAEQLEALRQQTRAMAAMFGIGPAEADEALDRKVVDNGDGTFSVRPPRDRIDEMQEQIEQLDLLSLFRSVRGPLLVYNAVSPEPSDTTGLLAAHRRGLVRELAAVERDNPHVRVITLDATHALIYEQPALIADQISAFLSEVEQS